MVVPCTLANVNILVRGPGSNTTYTQHTHHTHLADCFVLEHQIKVRINLSHTAPAWLCQSQTKPALSHSNCPVIATLGHRLPMNTHVRHYVALPTLSLRTRLWQTLLLSAIVPVGYAAAHVKLSALTRIVRKRTMTIHANSLQFMIIHDHSWKFIKIHDDSW